MKILQSHQGWHRQTPLHSLLSSTLLTLLLPCLATAQERVQPRSSSVSLDWSLESPGSPVRGFIVDYVPPVGAPPPGTMLSAETSSLVISDTIPATEYAVTITALLFDGSRHNITTKKVSSNPEPPTLESIETSTNEATVSYFPPTQNSAELGYNIVYHPIDRPEYATFVETKALLVRLRGLEPSTTYRIRIHSVFRGLLSTGRIDTSFFTKDETGAEPVTIRTLPPDFGEFLSREVTRAPLPVTSSEFAFPSGEILIHTSGEDKSTPAAEEDNAKEQEEETSSEMNLSTETIATTTTTAELTTVSTTSRTSARLSTELLDRLDTVSIKSTTVTPTRRPTTTSRTTVARARTTTPPRRITTTTVIVGEEVDTEAETTTTSRTTTTTERIEGLDEIEFVSSIESGGSSSSGVSPSSRPSSPSPSSLATNGFPAPSHIYLSKTNQKMLRLEWEAPDDLVCDSFLVNYTLLSMAEPTTFTVETEQHEVDIKMYTDHTIRMEVFCLLAGVASKTWWAHRVAQLSRPLAVSGLRVVSSLTDEFYVSSITLDLDWPSQYDEDHYQLVVNYAEGRTLADAKELIVSKKGPILIEQLEPTKWYTITVKNVSVELELSSAAKGVRQLTPPLISSQLYPGEISSTTVNVNFDPSDPEQGRFDHYELVFSGNAKNITKRIALHQARSFTFTKLIPGKTYVFELFTVFEGMRSRPVTANVTTYPLKVNKLFPIVGRNYVTLFWDIENFADNDCRFRLSYTGTSGTGHQTASTVVLKNKNTYRFGNLAGDTYYTFTIIVIMGLGAAEAESESEMVTIAITHDPPRSVPQLQRHGTRELSVQFENDPFAFTERNGEVDNFAVIVTENTELGGDDYELRSWFEVKDDEEWSAYRASVSDYNPFRLSRKKAATFIIGQDDCVQRNLDEPYCNGMLRSNVDYFVRIRAYTSDGIAMETEWVAVHGTTTDNTDADAEKERRLPCHMYLNGCPRKSAPKQSASFFQPILTLLGVMIPRRLR